MSAVHPGADETVPGAAFGLRDLGFVMGENVVHAAAMNVDLRPEQRGGHGAALDVPAGASLAPRTLPDHVAIGLIPGFPEREIADALLLILVVADASAGAQFVEVEVGELAVIGEFVEPEVDRLVFGLIRVAVFDQVGDHLDHPGDVDGVGGRGERGRRLDAQCFEVFKKGVLEFLRELCQREPGGLTTPDRFVVHVGQIHHAVDLEPPRLQVTLEEVFKQVGAEVADVGVVVDRGAARVELDGFPGGVEGPELFKLAGIGVEKANRHGRTGSVADFAGQERRNSGELSADCADGRRF